MGLYNFQPRFVPHILAGEKQHTIRETRVHPDKPGNTLHLYTGLRHKGARLLMRVPCVRVEEIIIDRFGFVPYKGRAVIQIAGAVLDRSEMESLARCDGFVNLAEMMAFWDGRLPFRGQIIYWTARAA